MSARPWLSIVGHTNGQRFEQSFPLAQEPDNHLGSWITRRKLILPGNIRGVVDVELDMTGLTLLGTLDVHRRPQVRVANAQERSSQKLTSNPFGAPVLNTD
ncbi:unnamed protein product [Phytophthora fragariaefolia]|uniref:Unnamed protein product n=1 Tax=Phytophthora fragariaefolia TaxID=1490495 RepID=A0A9W6Y1S3_9STRA|nr:unnamed protein product [Phytophthora fragariaefolia]